jgi:DNA polymerase-3 subunit delta'
MVYSWQERLWRDILGAKTRLPHALLLYGRRGIGKLDFAKSLAQALLCEALHPSGQGCGGCVSCNWFAAGTHPDFRLLEPEAENVADEDTPAEVRQGGKKAGNLINIAQIRELADFVTLSSSRNGARVILIHPAEAMNIHAANGLLKTLEEPPPFAVFILVSHQPQKLPATVRSRCQKIRMPVPSYQESLAWLSGQGVGNPELCLAQAGHAPLRAVSVCAEEYQNKRAAFLSRLGDSTGFDPLATAEWAQGFDLSWVVGWLQTWICDLASMRLTGAARYQLDFARALQNLAKQVDLIQLFDYHGEVLSVQRTLEHPLNPRLLLERLLIGYQQLVTGKEPLHV